MKDMNDVISYLTNVLGPYHDLTIAARTNISAPPKEEYSHADECILWFLSGLIHQATADDIVWECDAVRQYTGSYLIDLEILEDAICECELGNDYPEESEALKTFYETVTQTIDSPRFDELFKIITRDCAGDVLYYLTSLHQDN